MRIATLIALAVALLAAPAAHADTRLVGTTYVPIRANDISGPVLSGGRVVWGEHDVDSNGWQIWSEGRQLLDSLPLGGRDGPDLDHWLGLHGSPSALAFADSEARVYANKYQTTIRPLVARFLGGPPIGPYRRLEGCEGPGPVCGRHVCNLDTAGTLSALSGDALHVLTNCPPPMRAFAVNVATGALQPLPGVPGADGFFGASSPYLPVMAGRYIAAYGPTALSVYDLAAGTRVRRIAADFDGAVLRDDGAVAWVSGDDGLWWAPPGDSTPHRIGAVPSDGRANRNLALRFVGDRVLVLARGVNQVRAESLTVHRLDGRSAVLARNTRDKASEFASAFLPGVALDGERAAWAMRSCGATHLYVASDLEAAQPIGRPACAARPRVAAARRLDRRNRLRVRIVCPAGCLGRVAVTDPGIAGRSPVLGRASVSAGPGARAVVRVKLRKPIRRRQRLAVELVARDRANTPVGRGRLVEVAPTRQ